ncbi:MAG: hypothetical protein CMI09_12185 [Oceanospirillaceae bacterium]|nr:hypothetical protein [Oceanospirillaceae bacterium]
MAVCQLANIRAEMNRNATKVGRFFVNFVTDLVDVVMTPSSFMGGFVPKCGCWWVNFDLWQLKGAGLLSSLAQFFCIQGIALLPWIQ